MVKYNQFIQDYNKELSYEGFNNFRDNINYIEEFNKKNNTYVLDINKFAEILDLSLQSLNSDYEAKRYKDSTLELPKIIKGRKNLFYDWLRSRNKLGGQNKIPRLSNSREYVEELLGIN